MLKSLKINTALFICSAFILRLLFVNIGIISSLSTHQNNRTVKHHFSTKLKRRRNPEVSASPESSERSVVEICEESSNEDSQLKSNPLLSVQILYSLFADKVTNGLKKILPFNKHFSFTGTDRYLTFRAFRI